MSVPFDAAATLAQEEAYQTISKVLGTLLPGALLLITLFHDAWNSAEVPNSLRTFVQHIKAPFSSFLTLDDLADPLGLPVLPATSRTRILIGIAAVQSAISTAAFVSAAATANVPILLHWLLSFMSWVGFSLCSRPKVPVD